MKKILFTLILTSALAAKADFNLFDPGTYWQAAGQAFNVINQNLENLRLASRQNLNIQSQWDLACSVTKSVNPGLMNLNKFLAENKINQKLCAPITPLIKYQIDIIANCNNFYNRPVPENAQLLLQKFAITVFQSKLILTKCYPELAKLKLPIPGAN